MTAECDNAEIEVVVNNKECHRFLCEKESVSSNNIWIMLVRHKIASLDTCEGHNELIHTMAQNLFRALAEFWLDYQRCLEETWEKRWEKNVISRDLEKMFQKAIKGLKIISFIRNEMKPELILHEKYQLLEEAYDTIAYNTEDIKQKIFFRRRKGDKRYMNRTETRLG